MKATLTELQRDTEKVLDPVIHAGQTVTLTDQGEDVAEIVPKRRLTPEDRKKAAALLRCLGPIDLPPRPGARGMSAPEFARIWRDRKPLGVDAAESLQKVIKEIDQA